MSSQSSDCQRGQFRTATKSVPEAVVVDGSGWDRAPGPRPTGQFASATKSVPGAVVVDGSGWAAPRLAAVAEELNALLAGLDAEERLKAVEALIASLNEKHQLNVTLTRKTA